MNNFLEGFFEGKKIFLTGHTGFKGSWLSLQLHSLGSIVTGYSLEPPTKPSLYEMARVNDCVDSIYGDICNFEQLNKSIIAADPDIVIHMAAQSLVIDGYEDPLNTYMSNVMGTVNLIEAVRNTNNTRALLVITSDKCYENKGSIRSFVEEDRLGGLDPYSSSKACAEMVTNAYHNSFFKNSSIAIASARAGNVLGGGDWASNRLIPDMIKSLSNGKTVEVRSPKSMRPWQHVLDPLQGYLRLAKCLFEFGSEYSGAWNFGPHKNNEKNVDWIVNYVCGAWSDEATWISIPNKHKEARLLSLNSAKAIEKLDFKSKWDLETTLGKTVDWYKTVLFDGKDAREKTLAQISEYLE